MIFFNTKMQIIKYSCNFSEQMHTLLNLYPDIFVKDIVTLKQ